MREPAAPPPTLLPEQRLPALFLTRYLYFLGRRPISRSNTHYLSQRLAGLKALGAMLEERPPAALAGVLGRLARLTAVSFQRLYPALRDELKAFMRQQLSADVVISTQPPDGAFLRQVRRVLLVLGPAIGVGDEIITFSIPTWLRRALPDVEVTVLSAYGDLWQRVAGVRRSRAYALYPEVVEAIRGRGPDGVFDLVLMVDFESPGLFPAICDEPGVARYVEVSMAGRSIVAFDGRRRWLHRLERTGPYFENHYDNLAALCSWLGLPASLDDRRSTVVGRGSGRRDDELVVLVSPFSSKHDPIEDYWSRLLAAVVPPERAAVTRMVFDTGPNAATEGFARRLARITEGRAPYGVRCRVARAAEGPILSLQGVFRQMEEAHALICVDSFAAHAGPLFGCTTFVLAPGKLESWRVPAAQSYYFDAAAPLAGIAAGIRQVLAIDGGEAVGEAERWLDGRCLIEATDGLARALERGAATADLCEAYEALRRAGSALFARSWPEALAELFADRSYPSLLPPLPAGSHRVEGQSAADLGVHLRDKLARWCNTNLWKLLEREAGRTEALEAAPVVATGGVREEAR